MYLNNIKMLIKDDYHKKAITCIYCMTGFFFYRAYAFSLLRIIMQLQNYITTDLQF